jgi:hypothetical protein
MRQQLFLIAVTVGWFAVTTAPGQAVAEEPVYKGRPLREWVAQLKDDTPLERRGAARALGALGAQAREAVEPLVAMLDDKVESVREAAAEALGRIGGPEVAAYLYDLVNREVAAEARDRIGLAAGMNRNKAAPSALRQCLRDAPENTLTYVRQGMQRREQGLRDLVDKRAKDAIDSLAEWDAARPSAVDLLGLWSRAKDHAKAIRAALERSKQPEARSFLRALLLQLSPEDARAAVPELVKAARFGWRAARREKGDRIALQAALQLALIGRPAVAPLRGVLREGDPAERAGTALLLGLIGPDAESAAEDLRAACKARDDALRMYAALALLSVCPDKAQAAFPILRGKLGADWVGLEPEEAFRLPPETDGGASLLLGYLPVIFALANCEDARTAEAAVEKILKTEKKRPDFPFARNDGPWVATRIEAYGLCAAGQVAKGAVPALCRALDDEDPCTRVCAAYALARSSPPNRKKALAVLVDTATELNPPNGVSFLLGAGDGGPFKDDVISNALLMEVQRKQGGVRGFPVSYLADQLGIHSLREVDPTGRSLALAALEDLAREPEPKAGSP